MRWLWPMAIFKSFMGSRGIASDYQVTNSRLCINTRRSVDVPYLFIHTNLYGYPWVWPRGIGLTYHNVHDDGGHDHWLDNFNHVSSNSESIVGPLTMPSFLQPTSQILTDYAMSNTWSHS